MVGLTGMDGPWGWKYICSRDILWRVKIFKDGKGKSKVAQKVLQTSGIKIGIKLRSWMVGGSSGTNDTHLCPEKSQERAIARRYLFASAAKKHLIQSIIADNKFV